MKKHYIYVLQLVLLIFFSGISYGQTTVIDPAGDGGFENGTTFSANGWISTTNGNNTRWVCEPDATSGFSGNRSAYVSNGSSAPYAHNYQLNRTRTTHLYRDVTIPAGATNILLDFRWISDGEYTSSWGSRRVWDAMTVWLVPTSYTPTYGAVIGTGGGRLQLNSDYYDQDTWTNETNISIPNTYANSTFRLVFEWRNDGSSGSQPPAGIDNVYLRYTSPTPTITSVPTSSVCPGNSITITGTNLASATSASIGGTAATITGTTSTTVTLTVGNGATGTVSITTPSGTATSSGSLMVNSNSVAPTGITGTTTVCANETTTLTLTGGSAGTGATAEWFSGSCGGVHVGTGNSVSVLPSETTTYFVRYEGDCNTTTCASVTVTVENSITGGAISGDDSVCQGDNNITYSVSGMLNATSYLWTVPTGATIESGQNTNSITVNYGASAINGNVSVTDSNTCGNHTVTLPITVNTAPTIELTSAVDTDSQTLCINSSLIPITYEIGGSATGASLSGALPAGVNYGFSAGVLTISGTPTASGSFNYTVTTTGGDCGTTSASGTIEVDALPTLTLTSAPTTANQTLCILTPITNITYAVGGAATDASVTGLPAGVTGTYANGVLTISGTPTEAGPFNYTVTTSGSSCTAATISGSMTVNPLPDEAGTISGIDELCQGEEGVVYSVPAITNATTGYNWTVPPGAVIIAGANTNTITVDFPMGASSGNITVEGVNDCGAGVSFSLPITVNITPFIDINYSPMACSGEEVSVAPADGGGNIVPPGTTYSWNVPTPMPAGLSGATALSGQANFNQTLTNSTSTVQTVSYDVTATTAGCSSSTFTVFVTVYPKPIAQGLPVTQEVCANTPITTINFSQTTSVSGTISYSWTRDNTDNVGGLGTVGSGSSINASLTNVTNIPQTTTFTVIASTQDGCDSDPFYVSVTVDPTPTVAASPQTQFICSEGTITPIALTNPNAVSGTTYSWMRSNTANITGIPDGSGNSITGSLTNTTNVPQTTIFTITAWANGCPSSTTTASVTVNPKPTVEVNLPTQSLCAGTPISDIVISNPNNVAGVTYSWTRTNTANLTGIANSGSGSTISGTLINNTGTAQTTIFTVRATSGTCYSETTASVLVRPTPIVIVENPTTQTICNNESATITLGTSNVPIAGTTYSWTLNPNPNITASGPTSGTGNIITKTYQNSSTTPQVVSYTITATAGTCTTTTTVSPVTVYPPLEDPEISDNQAVCLLARPTRLNIDNLTELGGSGTYTYQWQRSDDGVGGWTNIAGATSSSYQPPTIPLIGAQNYYYRVRVINSCNTVISNPVFIQVISNAGFDFSVDDDLNGEICPGETFLPSLESIHASSSAVRYSWTADSNFITPAIGGPVGTTSGRFFFGLLRTSTGNIGPLTVQNNTNATVTTELEITPAVYEYAGNNPGPGDFICSISPQYISVTIRPTPVASTPNSNLTICSGTSPDIIVNGNITDATMQFSWTRNNTTNVIGDNAGSSGNITTPINSYTLINNLINTTSTTQEVVYTITPTSNGCSGAPIYVTVSVAPDVTPGAIVADQTVCTNGDPVAFTQTTAATGLNLSYQWQISTTSATTGFTDILGATNALYDAPGPLTQNTWYRRIATSTVNGVNCSSAPSNAVEVTVNIIDPGTISGEQTVCSGGDPGVLSSSAPATGVTGTLSYQWQMNTTGCGEPDGSWSDISGANNATYDPPNGLLVTTYYRRVARFSTGSCSEVSNCITVYVNNVTGGDVAGDQAICSTDPDAFTEATASTGTGALTYQWQLSTTSSAGPWTNISGAYSATYDPPSGVTTTTYYKRVTTSTLNGQACTADSASVITVTASTLEPGTITGNRAICSGDIPAAFAVNTAATVGSGGITYQWQSSTISGAGPWTDIAGATSDIYTFTSSVATTTYYQRVATSTLTGCSKVSNFLVVYVNDVTPSVIAGDQTVCNTDDPAAFTVTTAASTSGPGTLSYQWQRSTTNAPYVWTNIPTATGATYNPPVLETTTYYRVMVTSRLNSVNCSDASNIVTVTVNPFVQATASSATPANCGDTTIQLTANGIGTWSAIPRTTGALYSFSDINDVDATFTGESGVIYDITWTIVNPAPCAESRATFALAFPACANNIDFNGTNNYTNFRDAFDFTGDFSIELWVKRNTVGNGKQTLFSKRDANDLSTGYDLSLQNGQLTFNWNAGGTLQTAETLDDSRWYHVAVTYDGNYRLYIDGIELASAAGSLPSSNAFNALLGATGVAAGIPQDYYNGSVDELRIWNTGLTEAQIREMMNQEIESYGTAVRGSVLGLDVAGLSWTDLEGYYQMNQGTSDIAAGQLADNSKTGTGNVGTLTNMVSNQLETAPLPYNTASNGNWNSLGTWLNGGVQQLPNSVGIDGNTTVDWNIVRTRHNVISDTKDLTILGLIVEANELTITGPGAQDETNPGTGLWVTHYLKIDGKIDLVGESQLVQKRYEDLQVNESFFDSGSIGVLERDQQGTGNPFNYNYWSSPVSSDIGTFTLLDVLRAGTISVDDPFANAPITWITGHTPNPVFSGGNTIQLTTRWLYTYNGTINYYTEWNRINNTTPIGIGLGFSMKGNGADPGPTVFNGSTQNYVFVGKPNNGTILNNVAAGNSILLGNPYPSAIDADKFINDNIGILDDGSLSFWEHYPANNTHVVRNYVGGYAKYNLVGGQAAVTPPPTLDGYGIVDGYTGTREPTQYIPVAQGFFVSASTSGGHIVFNNSQRVFSREAGGESIFFRASEGGSKATQKRTTSNSNDIQRVRLTFKTPEGAIRPLLLGFTPNNAASDGIDYGYDAYNNDGFPSDLSFAIEGKKFVIQGVGAFDINKKYPLDMLLKIAGNIEIALSELENFDTDPDIFIYDALLDTYTKINDVSFQTTMKPGQYKDRFYIAFQPDTTLSIIDEDFKDISVKYLQKTDEIYVKTPASIEVRQVYLVNMAGQAVRSWNMTNMNFGQEFKIPVKDISEGNYVLKVETNTNSYNKKVIIKF